uniref:Uncharacterized protein n=1 Tax=Tetranychus urticae TaxID=32264 RepID=T1JW84_TETUR
MKVLMVKTEDCEYIVALYECQKIWFAFIKDGLSGRIGGDILQPIDDNH